MERCGVQLYRGSRRSFEKGAHGEAPPRLQVIGFDVSPKEGGTPPSLLPVIKPAASSPRSSALQHQLLLHQSPPNSPSPSSNQSLPPAPLLPSSSNQSLPRPPLSPPYSSSSPPSAVSPASNLHLPCGLLLPPVSNQRSTSGGLRQPAANPKPTTGGLLQPAANPNSIVSAFSISQPPPASAYHGTNSSSVQLKSLLQSECASSHAPANQSSRTNFVSSVGQSQCANSSSSITSGNPSINDSALSVNMQIINQHSSNVSKAVMIKQNSIAFLQIKQTGGDEAAKEFRNGNDADAHEISVKHGINELPYNIVVKSQNSSWLHDSIEHRSPEKSTRISGCGSEEKSKKSSLFMLTASSPAAEFHHHHHCHAEQCNAASGNMDFLSSCHLCRRLLRQDEDVFMYSGDKAFCSMECRYQQIVMDERKERCPPPIIRSGASQVYQHSSVTATTTHHPIVINKPHFINTAAAA